jgi:alkylation response protein AidB-like acyl-CoA dehydrogenase
MTDFTLKQHDTSPALRYQLLTETGDPVDLAGVTGVRFRLAPSPAETARVDAEATVESATEGIVAYDWTAADTSKAGRFVAEWEVTYADGTVETFPNRGYLEVRVRPDLG